MLPQTCKTKGSGEEVEIYLKEADVPLVGCFANDTENRFTAGIHNNSEEIKRGHWHYHHESEKERARGEEWMNTSLPLSVSSSICLFLLSALGTRGTAAATGGTFKTVGKGDVIG